MTKIRNGFIGIVAIAAVLLAISTYGFGNIGLGTSKDDQIILTASWNGWRPDHVIYSFGQEQKVLEPKVAKMPLVGSLSMTRPYDPNVSYYVEVFLGSTPIGREFTLSCNIEANGHVLDSKESHVTGGFTCRHP